MEEQSGSKKYAIKDLQEFYKVHSFSPAFLLLLKTANAGVETAFWRRWWFQGEYYNVDGLLKCVLHISVKARALSAVVSLQSGDEDLTRKWLKICDVSFWNFCLSHRIYSFTSQIPVSCSWVGKNLMRFMNFWMSKFLRGGKVSTISWSQLFWKIWSVSKLLCPVMVPFASSVKKTGHLWFVENATVASIMHRQISRLCGRYVCYTLRNRGRISIP